jgi:hypothetical protein
MFHGVALSSMHLRPEIRYSCILERNSDPGYGRDNSVVVTKKPVED